MLLNLDDPRKAAVEVVNSTQDGVAKIPVDHASTIVEATMRTATTRAVAPVVADPTGWNLTS